MNIRSYFQFLKKYWWFLGIHTSPKGCFTENSSCWGILLDSHLHPFLRSRGCVWDGGFGTGVISPTPAAKVLVPPCFPWFICTEQESRPEMCPWLMGAFPSLSTGQSGKGKLDFQSFPSALCPWLMELHRYLWISTLLCSLLCSCLVSALGFLSLQLFPWLTPMSLFFLNDSQPLFWCSSILLHQSLKRTLTRC